MLNHNYIGTEHLLLGLIHEGGGVAAQALESLGIPLLAVRSQVEGIVGRGKSVQSGHIPFTPRAKKVLELSLREALALGNDYIGTEHILLGLIREGEGVAAQVLQKLGADLNRVRQQVIQLVPASVSIDVVSMRQRSLDPVTEPAYGMLQLAAQSARDLGHDAIEPADLLLGLVVGANDQVVELLASWGVDIEAIRRRIEELAAEEEHEGESE